LKILKTPYKKKTDEQLFVVMQNGNTEAFNELYSRYNQRLLYFFYRMLGSDQEQAQDFLQELFLKILDKPYLFDTSKRFSTWIYSIAHNMCKNEYRNRQVRNIIVKEEFPDRFEQESTEKKNPEKIVETIFEILKTFDDSHQTAFLLKYREGFSIDEISGIMELPTGTIKSRLHYTRKKLQEKLTGNHAELIENFI